MSAETQTPPVDKSAWGPGPWQDEPDRVDWIAHGFACFVKRHDRYGNWCGYCGVPNGHPAYGKPYDDVDVEIHGGLTYADQCKGTVCHVPAPGMPDDVWWLGMDFGHFHDLCPGMNAMLRASGGANLIDQDTTYRTIAYARAQVDRLAAQLAGIK